MSIEEELLSKNRKSLFQSRMLRPYCVEQVSFMANALLLLSCCRDISKLHLTLGEFYGNVCKFTSTEVH